MTPKFFNSTDMDVQVDGNVSGHEIPERQWNRQTYVAMPVVIIVGAAGNVLAAIVMLRPRFRKLSTSVYLLLLAFADTGCLLLNHKVQYWMMKDTGVSLFSVPWLCRIYLWLTLSVPFVSSWLVVLVSLERVVIVCRPLHAKVWCTRGNAWRASLALVLFMFLGNTYVFLIVKSEKCDPEDDRLHIITIVAAVFFSGLPSISIVLCNIIISTQLIRQRWFMAKELPPNFEAHGDTARLTFMLLVNTCVFLILTLPYNVILAYKQTGQTPNRRARVTSDYLICINHACNFFLYTVSGSLYRQELVEMFRRLGTREAGSEDTDRKPCGRTECMNGNTTI